jgi:hypothetical protein
MSLEKIDKSDFDTWYKSSITQDILKSLKDRKSVLENQIMNLACGSDLKCFYDIKYIRGLIAAYDEIINISYADMGGKIDE